MQAFEFGDVDPEAGDDRGRRRFLRLAVELRTGLRQVDGEDALIGRVAPPSDRPRPRVVSATGTTAPSAHSPTRSCGLPVSPSWRFVPNFALTAVTFGWRCRGM